jgi:hypothetical protein
VGEDRHNEALVGQFLKKVDRNKVTSPPSRESRVFNRYIVLYVCNVCVCVCACVCLCVHMCMCQVTFATNYFPGTPEKQVRILKSPLYSLWWRSFVRFETY